jgi:hypothetical protein
VPTTPISALATMIILVESRVLATELVFIHNNLVGLYFRCISFNYDHYCSPSGYSPLYSIYSSILTPLNKRQFWLTQNPTQQSVPKTPVFNLDTGCVYSKLWEISEVRNTFNTRAPRGWSAVDDPDCMVSGPETQHPSKFCTDCFTLIIANAGLATEEQLCDTKL